MKRTRQMYMGHYVKADLSSFFFFVIEEKNLFNNHSDNIQSVTAYLLFNHNSIIKVEQMIQTK